MLGSSPSLGPRWLGFVKVSVTQWNFLQAVVFGTTTNPLPGRPGADFCLDSTRLEPAGGRASVGIAIWVIDTHDKAAPDAHVTTHGVS